MHPEIGAGYAHRHAEFGRWQGISGERQSPVAPIRCTVAAMVRFLLVFFLAFASSLAGAQVGVPQGYAEDVIVCPIIDGPDAGGAAAIPDGTAKACERVKWWQVDAQGRHLWVLAEIELAQESYNSNKPLAVFVSAKASSEVFLNGIRLGANGVPADSKQDEVPGKMDAVFFAPRAAMRAGKNVVATRMSSHHGFLTFGFPTHQISIGDYRSPTNFVLRRYWPSFVPFGVLIAGAIFFATTATQQRRRRNAILLALMSVFAAGQLFSEVFRGISPYLYPMHEWRMLIIVFFSVLFGLALTGYVTTEFFRENWRRPFFAISALMVTSVFLVTSYDEKAALGVLVPSTLSALIALYAVLKKKPLARLYFIALSLFSLSTVLFPNAFLDALFFYEVGALMLALFAFEAMAIVRDRQLLQDERVRSRQLEVALERAQNSETSAIKINSAGKIEIIPSDQISFCKGAGDYVEFTLKDGREILHNGSLTQLEQDLPPSFLRVHRSYLVNTDYVRSLKRESTGVGILLLTNNAEVPVSRRIMPKVRSALN